MRGSENRAEQQTKPTDNQVCNTKEIVLAADDRSCGNENLLGTAIFRDWKVCADSISV